MRHFARLADLKAHVGQEIGVSDWFPIEQERIDKFAEATGDFQWIHVDRERAAQGPFGATIAHGFLTLSLLPLLLESTIAFDDVKMGVNYGLNRVRFTAPGPVGSELRARIKLLSVEDIPGNGIQMVTEVTIERRGSDKPVCIAESISRRYA